MTRLATYNVNGLRAAITKGLIDWIAESDIDVICFQETKSLPDQVDTTVFEDMGYYHYWHSAEKKGYSGVLTLTKKKPEAISTGFGMDKYDSEGRTVVTHFKDWSLVNVYIPSGSSGDDRHLFKMDFVRDFGPWIQNLKKDHPNLVIVGDYNIVHKELDIHNPERKDEPSGYKPDERAWLDEWFVHGGFTDAFRHLHPEERKYSWWSYRAGARQKDKGWRIDYISVSDSIADKIRSCEMYKDVMHSDHCAVVCTLNF
jgi:exodeoxyribonuclease III